MLRPERTMLLHITRGRRFIVISGGDGASGRVCTRWKKQWASHWLFTAHFPQKMYLGGFGHKLLMRTLWQWQSFYPAVQVRQRQKFRKNQERKERRLMDVFGRNFPPFFKTSKNSGTLCDILVAPQQSSRSEVRRAGWAHYVSLLYVFSAELEVKAGWAGMKTSQRLLIICR